MFKWKEDQAASGRQPSPAVEIAAGVTTFCAMVYVLAVNPALLAKGGVPQEALFTATALAAILGTLAMAFIANLPFAVAPGMGINAFFVFGVVLSMHYSWPQAVAAVLIAGVIFLLLSLSPLREKILKEIPPTLQYAVCGGVGVMIAGIGLIQSHVIIFDSGLPALGQWRNGEVRLVLIGLVVTAVMLSFKFRYALLAGIIASTLIGIPLGVTKLNFLSQSGLFSLPPNPAPLLFNFDFSPLTSFNLKSLLSFPTQWKIDQTLVAAFDFLAVVLTFVFIAIVDSLAGFLGLFSIMGDEAPRYRSRLGRAFVADSLAVVISSCLGISPNTAYGESGTGVAVGGRTGLTAVTVALGFGLALFCASIFLAIPFAAVAPALVVVGWYMLTPLTRVNFKDPTESFPAVVAVVLIGLSWKISDSLAIAWLTYVLMKVVASRGRELNLTVCLVGAVFALKLIAQTI